jgi:hypothetical protein
MLDCVDLIDDLYQEVCISREQLHQIVAKSPAPIAWCGDNIDSLIINPEMYEKYCLPVYKRQAEVFHPAGKLIAVHMDGRLKQLKELISRTPIDVVEAFHPEPMGDLPLPEALKAWSDKSLWIGFPGSVYQSGPESVKDFALDLLKQAGTGERLAITMSTENLVSNQNLIALASILEKAKLPLSAKSIQNIAQSI